MSTGSDRTYQIEHWVRSNLRSHNGKPFTFDVAGPAVTVQPPAAGDQANGFVTKTRLRAEALLLAERAAHDAVTALLDVLCYEMRVSGLVERPVRSQVEGSGPIRRCIVYSHEPRQRSFFLMERNAEEIQQIVRDQPDTNVHRTLHWLRWAYNARTVPEAFLFAWMAVERLVGEQKIVARCSKCQAPVKCDKHGEHSYSTVPRKSIEALLESHGMTGMKILLRLRNPLAHGSLEHNFMQRIEMKLQVPDLVRAVENELRARLKATDALPVSPLSGPGAAIVYNHCEYRTAFPDKAFPPDCPTLSEVGDYKEAFRQGHQHPKIINLLPLPADW